MRLSIIVCANRDNPFFVEALDSLAAARGGMDDVETVLIANGGWNPPAEIAERFDKVIRLAEGGLGRARNEGARQAAGEWITFFDSDDALDRAYIEQTLRAVAMCDVTRDIVFNVVVMMDEKGNPFDDGFRLERLPSRISTIIAHPFTGATLVIGRKTFVLARGYEWQGYAEDYELTLRLMRSPHNLRIVRNPQSIYLYRQHADTMSGSSIKKIEGVRDVQLHHARKGNPLMYIGVLISRLRLLKERFS